MTALDPSPRKQQPGLSRRSVLALAAWSAPVIASSASLPAVAASSPTISMSLTSFPASLTLGQTTGTGVITVLRGGTGFAATAVKVSLRGLQWLDGSTGPRTLTTVTGGLIALSGQNSLTAATAGQAFVVVEHIESGKVAGAMIDVVAAAGYAWWSDTDAAHPLSDTAPALGSLSELALAQSVVYAKGADGSWQRWVWGQKQWTRFTTPASVDSLVTSENNNYCWALSGGRIYLANAQLAEPVVCTALAGVVELAGGKDYLYARTADGSWYQQVNYLAEWTRIATPGRVESIAVNESGNSGWALIDGEAYLSNDGKSIIPTAKLGRKIVRLAVGSSVVHALTEDGAWYCMTWNATSWTLVKPSSVSRLSVNEGGNRGWAILTDGSVIWYRDDLGTIITTNPVPSGMAELAVGSSVANGRANDGTWYRLHWTASDWTRVTGVGPIKRIHTAETSDHGWALV